MQAHVERSAPHASARSAANMTSMLTPLELQRTAGNRATVALLRGFGSRPGIQRDVTDFKVSTRTMTPPASDLMKTLDADDLMDEFKDSPAAIKKIITQALNHPLVKDLDVPEQIVAELDTNKPTAPKRTKRSANVGQMGQDEFFIKSGQVEAFEGGHLLPHHLWDTKDTDVENADGYTNLVPMSRTMNVINWSGTEKWLDDKISKVPNGDRLEVTIDVDREDYDMTLGDISKRFKLPLENTADQTQSFQLYGWLPKTVKAGWKHIETMSEDEHSDVEEGMLHNTHRQISTPQDLLEFLQSTPAWQNMTPEMRKKVTKIK